jgi:EAL and modified HD-GYP domain-containing signal transduction protein
MFATSTVVANAFAEIGLAQVIGPVDGYLNVDTEFLYSELIEALPPDRIVLELYEQRIVDEATITRCRELRKRGYRIALDDFVGNFDELDKLLPSVDVVKVDFHRIDPLLVPMIVKMLRRFSVKLIAEKIETPAQFAQAQSLGIDLFQGFHFAHPQVISAKRAKPAKMALLRLLALAMDDGDLRKIEDEFKRHPNLSVNLLRLVNSAAMRRAQSVSSLRHALVLLGRRQLRVWLQLLLYTADRGDRGFASPLLQLAAVRGKLMELLATRQAAPDGTLKELAFITGILSLMAVLLEIPHVEILRELNLPVPVETALLQREGEIGEWLTLAEGLEREDGKTVSDALGRIGNVDHAELVQMQLAAYQWANEIAVAA